MDLADKIEIVDALINLDAETTIEEYVFVLETSGKLNGPLTTGDLQQMIHCKRNEK